MAKARKSFLVTVTYTVEKTVRVKAQSAGHAAEDAKLGKGSQEDYTESDYEILNVEED